MIGPVNAYGRSNEVTIVVKVEPDPHPRQGDGIATYRDLVGRAVVSVRDLGVDESRVGATVLALLAETLEGGEPS